ncbi:MAG: glycosyltransferase family 39 protein [Phycisphaerales bacterium]
MLRNPHARAAIALVLALLVLRILYLVFLSPYTLVDDESHYWEWSRRLAPSYYTKGPGIAWTIAVSTRLFGDIEWAVRLPAALASAIAALALARLASDASEDRRAPLLAAVIFTLIPIHLALAILMTIDGPYLACWSLTALFAHRALILDRPRAWLPGALFLGLGFLFKYTILLLLLGILLAALLTRRPRPLTRHLPWLALATLVFLLAISPVLLWNHQHDWPTVQHLLKHLGADAPQPAAPKTPREWSPLWPVTFLASQIGAIGPAIVLLALSTLRALRDRAAPQRASHLFLILCAAPVLLFYLAVSFIAEPEANWPLAGYATLIALSAAFLPPELDRYRALLTAWRADPARPRMGFLRRAPETSWQIAWHWTLAVGVVVALLLPRADLLARLPLLGPLIPTYRLMGADTRAHAAREFLDQIPSTDNAQPLILSELYGPASSLAFYLPDHPVTHCARAALGGEPSQYDYFPDTRLDNPSLEGRNALLIGADAERWSALFERVEPLGSLNPDFDNKRIARGRFPRYQVYVGYGYHPPTHLPR